MKRQQLPAVIWVLLVLVPMIPVVVFYAVFVGQNYFELKNAARGLVTTGPIAAYVVIFWLGKRAFMQVSSIVVPLGPFAAKLVDTSWSFTASSYHGTQRQGSFRIAEDEHGGLEMSGTFEDANGRNVGSWESTMAHSEDGRLEVVYSLNDLRGDSPDASTGMLQLFADGDDPRRLSGNWVVLGRSEAHGEIVCTKDVR
jgi:hypothetical protein